MRRDTCRARGADAARKLETARSLVNSFFAAPAVACACVVVVQQAACGWPETRPPVGAPDPTAADASTPAAAERPADRPDALADGVELREAWRRDVGRGIIASPVVADDLIVVTTTDGRVAAYTLDDGTLRWRHDLDGSIRHGAVRHGDMLFVSSQARVAGGGDRPARRRATPRARMRRPVTDARSAGYVYALSLHTGDELWARALAAAAHAPALAGDTVYIAADDGTLTALHAASGERIWRRTLPSAAAVAPVAHDGALLAATTADTLYRLDARNGEVEAGMPLPATPSATPTLAGGLLLVPLHTGGLLAVDPRGLATRWSADLGEPVLARPVRAPDGAAYILTSSTQLWRVSGAAGTGPDAPARRIAPPDGAARASLAVADGRILIGRLDGTLLALDHDGDVLWERSFDESIVAPAVVRRDAVYVALLRGRLVKLEPAQPPADTVRPDPAAGPAGPQPDEPPGPPPAAADVAGTAGRARRDAGWTSRTDGTGSALVGDPAGPWAAQRADSRLRALWLAKWSTLAASLGASGYGFWAQHEAGRRHDRLERVCADEPARCGGGRPGVDAAYADPGLARTQREADRLEDRAVLTLVGGQLALAGAVALFALDMRESDAPPNLIYEPAGMSVLPNPRGGVRLRVRLRAP